MSPAETIQRTPGARVQRAPGLSRRLAAVSGERIGHLGVVALSAAAALAGAVMSSQFQLQVLTVAFLNAALAGGLVVAFGYCGLLNLSHGTFYGMGAYATALLITDHGFSFLSAALVAMAVGALGGLLLGAASLRISGDFFALVSLAFTGAMFEVMQDWTAVTRGREGFFGIPPVSVLGVSLDNFKSAYFAVLALLVVTYLVVRRFARTFAGRAMLAVRFDELAARAMGVNVPFTKLLAMAFSSALAGLAGAFLTATVLFIQPSDFDIISSFNISLWVIIGGMASLPGAVIVGGVLAFVTEEFRSLSDYRVGLMGVIVLAAVYFRGGVVSDLVTTRVARRRAGRKAVARDA